MKTRELLPLALLLASTAGCTVTAVSPGEDPRPRNSCSQDDECGSGFSCSFGVCQTLNGDLESLLITASPPSDSSVPHFTFVTELDDVPTDGGNRDITLLAPPQVTGTLMLPVSMSCYPAFLIDVGQPMPVVMPAATDRSVPVTVTLALHQRALGLSQQIYYAKTGSLVGRGYSFGVKVPAGRYDVYLAPPTSQSGTTCVAPPQLYRDFPIRLENGEQATTTILFKLPVVSRLNLRVLWPQSSPPLDGWVADIIEPSGGNAISTQVVLGEPTPREDNTIEYAVPLSYSTTMVGYPPAPDSTGELLRLRPPADSNAPTIYLDRAALGLLQTNPDDDVRLTAFTRLPRSVNVHGQLLRRDGGTSVAGTVTLVSTEIYGVDSGVFASYRTTAEASSSGLIDITLPPGKYRVHGLAPQWTDTTTGDVPLDPLSAGETTWDIPADLPIQFGKVLELPPFTELGGHARVPGSQVRAIPSPRTASPFEAAFGDAALYPRFSSGLVDDAGRFALQVDPGLFDVTAQAPEELGWGWYVRPGVEVASRDLELGIELRRPSVLSGTASIALPGGTQPLASAAISAYAYLNKDHAYTRDPEQAVSVVQVAETRAGADGRFRLLLPASIITAPKP